MVSVRGDAPVGADQLRVSRSRSGCLVAKAASVRTSVRMVGTISDGGIADGSSLSLKRARCHAPGLSPTARPKVRVKWA